MKNSQSELTVWKLKVRSSNFESLERIKKLQACGYLLHEGKEIIM